MALPERNLNHPATVGLPLHRRGFGMPIVKIPDDGHVFGRRGRAHEINRLDRFFG
jgi:hypothetical protein